MFRYRAMRPASWLVFCSSEILWGSTASIASKLWVVSVRRRRMVGSDSGVIQPDRFRIDLGILQIPITVPQPPVSIRPIIEDHPPQLLRRQTQLLCPIRRFLLRSPRLPLLRRTPKASAHHRLLLYTRGDLVDFFGLAPVVWVEVCGDLEEDVGCEVV